MSLEGQKTAAEVVKEQLEGIKSSIMARVDEVAAKVGNADEVRKEVETKLADMESKIAKQAEQLNAANRNSMPGVEEEARKKGFSFARFATLAHPILGGEVRDVKEYGLEREVQIEMLKRAQTAGDGTAGGYLVPTELSSMIIEPAIAAMPLYSIGMQTLSDVQGTFDIPVLSSRGTAGHATENTSATEVSMTFGKYTMTPKRAAGFVKVSKRLLRQGGAGIEGFIRKELINTLRVEMHSKLVNGSGSSGQPTGICQATGFTTSSPLSAAGQFLLKHASVMMTDLEESDVNVESGSMGFLTRPIVTQGMKLERTLNYSGQTAGKGYAITPAILSDAELADRIGAKFAKTTHVPTSGSAGDMTTQVVYGDWSRFLLALWSGLEVRASDVASDGTNHAFIQNMVFIAAEQEYDCCCVQPVSFCKTTYAYANRTNWTAF